MFDKMTKGFGDLPTWAKVTCGVAGVAVLVCGGVALVGAETFIVVAGPLVFATGEAARVAAGKI